MCSVGEAPGTCLGTPDLPNAIREADTLCQFKSRLQTHLGFHITHCADEKVRGQDLL